MSVESVCAGSGVALTGGVLTVRNSTFRKSRLVPLHATSVRALKRYAEIRDRKVLWVQTTAFFVSDRGKPLKCPA